MTNRELIQKLLELPLDKEVCSYIENGETITKVRGAENFGEDDMIYLE